MNVKTAARKALKGTDWQALQDLLAAQSRWKRKLTIATNKLAETRDRIDRLAYKLSCEKVGIGMAEPWQSSLPAADAEKGEA